MYFSCFLFMVWNVLEIFQNLNSIIIVRVWHHSCRLFTFPLIAWRLLKIPTCWYDWSCTPYHINRNYNFSCLAVLSLWFNHCTLEWNAVFIFWRRNTQTDLSFDERKINLTSLMTDTIMYINTTNMTLSWNKFCELKKLALITPRIQVLEFW